MGHNITGLITEKNTQRTYNLDQKKYKTKIKYLYQIFNKTNKYYNLLLMNNFKMVNNLKNRINKIKSKIKKIIKKNNLCFVLSK